MWITLRFLHIWVITHNSAVPWGLKLLLVKYLNCMLKGFLCKSKFPICYINFWDESSKVFLCDLWILLICFLRHFYNILLLSVIGLNNVGPHFWWFQFWSFKLHLILMLPRIALLHVKGVQRCVTFKIKIHRYWILEPQISIPQFLIFKVSVALSHQYLVLFIRSMAHLISHFPQRKNLLQIY